MKTLLSLIIIFSLWSCQSSAQQEKKDYEITKTDAEWKAELSHRIPSFKKSSNRTTIYKRILDIKTEGTFVCAACENPLYETKHKFKAVQAGQVLTALLKAV